MPKVSKSLEIQGFLPGLGDIVTLKVEEYPYSFAAAILGQDRRPNVFWVVSPELNDRTRRGRPRLLHRFAEKDVTAITLVEAGNVATSQMTAGRFAPGSYVFVGPGTKTIVELYAVIDGVAVARPVDHAVARDRPFVIVKLDACRHLSVSAKPRPVPATKIRVKEGKAKVGA